MDGGARDDATAGGRPVRADARLNRARILDAAEEVFGAAGESASTEAVASRAGVGVATVFRHFPTKAALLEAVLVRRFDRLRDRAAALAGAADPGQAFFELFRHMVVDAPGKIAIAEALAESGGDPGRASVASARLTEAFGALLTRAQQAGAVRTDVHLPEVYALLLGASRAAAYSALEERVRDGALDIMFDGLAGGRSAYRSR